MRTLVALERADVRGFALVHPSYDPDSDQVADGEIGEFIVSPAHHRAGHGSRLLQAAVDTLRADSFTRATWWVTATDDAVRAFATSAGWAPDGAHRELADDAGRTLKQVRLHTSLV
jgi:GNAT superfamily N-acetyltransferase